MHKLHTVSEQ